MAGIDKTYTNSYQDYIDLISFAKGKEILFWTGQKERLSNYIYDQWESEDFEGDFERPVMNTSTAIDIYLIQNCNIPFVQNRMVEVYSKNGYKTLKETNLMLKPSHLKQNRKITIKETKRTKLPLYNNGVGSHKWWWLQCNEGDLWFDDESKLWVEGNLPNNTNTSHHKTVKSLIRFLRKQHLPTGITFRLTGRYVGEEFEVRVK